MTLIFSTIFLAICSASLLYYLYKLNFSYEFSKDGFSFWSNNVWVLFFETLAMIVYIPTAAFYAYARFEKTPSNEIAYFILFLLGCVPELLRPCIPLEIAGATFSNLLVIIGKALFWGRTLSFTSLFVASLILDSEKNLNAERHFVVMLRDFRQHNQNSAHLQHTNRLALVRGLVLRLDGPPFPNFIRGQRADKRKPLVPKARP